MFFCGTMQANKAYRETFELAAVDRCFFIENKEGRCCEVKVMDHQEDSIVALLRTLDHQIGD